VCDYSLMGIPNRLATQGEQLVTYKFPTGSMGLASPPDVQIVAASEQRCSNGFWPWLRAVFAGAPRCVVPAVCIPPGARLIVHDIPEDLQRKLGVGRTEIVTFTQTSAADHNYRDAIRFESGAETLLQNLVRGQRVWVLDLSSPELRVPRSTERDREPVAH